MPTPTDSNRRFAGERDRRACRGLIRTGSKSFYAASLLLPGAIRDPAYAIYAFCRLADDEVDLARDPAAGLERLRARLAGVYDGTPADIAADRALADTVRDYGIPKSLFDALLDGFDWDVTGRDYETLDDLYGYAARVAGTVGAIMALLMGRRAPDTLARACDLGVAMQLTNIARDVGEDARNGRIYLPLSWLREAGIDRAAFLADPRPGPALARTTARLLEEAERLYARAAPGIAALPLSCRPAINAARRLYAEIGREVARSGHDSVTRRAVVSKRRKLGLVVEAALEAPMLSPRPARVAPDPALAQTAFLVRAGSDPALRPRLAPGSIGIPKAVDARAGRILELFMELERRDRQANRPAAPPIGLAAEAGD